MSSSNTTRIDEELPVELVVLLSVSVPADHDVDIELALPDSEGVLITPGNDLVAVDDAEFEVGGGSDCKVGKVVDLVEVALGADDGGGKGAEVGEHFGGGDIARQEDGVDAAGEEHLLEDFGDFSGTVGDVEVANDEYENHFVVVFKKKGGSSICLLIILIHSIKK